MMSSYHNLRLADDISFCYYYDDIVLMRLSANKYSRLNARETIFLHQLSKAACAGEAPLAVEAPDSASGGVPERLVALGVLTRAAEAGRPVAPVVSAAPIEHLVDDLSRGTRRVRALHVVAFLWAAAAATLDLAWIAARRRGLDGPVRRIRKRNARLREKARPDEVRARDLVAIFNELRIYWPRKRLCRFDSLALIHFLACFGHCARWVFGVRLDPFAAHCWVQDERRLYNDDLERITQFQPILVVD